MLKKLTITLTFLFSIFMSAQNPYQWVLKQSGSSLGGPIDYLKYNPFIVYYGSNSIIYKSTDMGETFSQTGTSVPGASWIQRYRIFRRGRPLPAHWRVPWRIWGTS